MKGELSGRDKKDFSVLALRHELDEGRSLIKRKTKGNLLESRYAGHTDPHALHRESANLAFAPDTAKRLTLAGRSKAGDAGKMEEDVKALTPNTKYKYGDSPYYDRRVSKKHNADWEDRVKFLELFNSSKNSAQNDTPKKKLPDINSILSRFRENL